MFQQEAYWTRLTSRIIWSAYRQQNCHGNQHEYAYNHSNLDAHSQWTLSGRFQCHATSVNQWRLLWLTVSPMLYPPMLEFCITASIFWRRRNWVWCGLLRCWASIWLSISVFSRNSWISLTRCHFSEKLLNEDGMKKKRAENLGLYIQSFKWNNMRWRVTRVVCSLLSRFCIIVYSNWIMIYYCF